MSAQRGKHWVERSTRITIHKYLIKKFNLAQIPFSFPLEIHVLESSFQKYLYCIPMNKQQKNTLGTHVGESACHLPLHRGSRLSWMLQMIKSFLGKQTWEKGALFLFSSKIFLFFRQRGRVREREEEKHQYVVAFRVPPTWDLARNPGTCPDWESDEDPLVHRPELNLLSHTGQGRKVLILRETI